MKIFLIQPNCAILPLYGNLKNIFVEEILDKVCPGIDVTHTSTVQFGGMFPKISGIYFPFS